MAFTLRPKPGMQTKPGANPLSKPAPSNSGATQPGAGVLKPNPVRPDLTGKPAPRQAPRPAPAKPAAGLMRPKGIANKGIGY